MDNSLLKELAAARRRRASERGEQSPKRPRVAGDQASNASNDNGVIDLMASDDEAPPEDDAAMAARLQREEELDASAALAARLQGEELLRGAAEAVTHGPYAYPAARRRELVAAGARVDGLNVRCGSSGWQHGPRWSLYPPGTAREQQLEVYARTMGAVEVNGTYYNMQPAPVLRNWRRVAEAAPGHFGFALKVNKYFTHTKRLIVDDAFRGRWERDLTVFAELGDTCLVLLVSLPASFKRTPANLTRLRDLAALCRARDGFDPFFAVEFKHPSWFAGEVYDAIAASARLSLVSSHGYGPGSDLAPGAWYPPNHADALRCAHGKCFYTRLHGTIGESQGDYGEHHLLPLCDRLRQHSAGGGLSFVGLNNVGGEPPSAIVDAATIAARLNGP